MQNRVAKIRREKKKGENSTLHHLRMLGITTMLRRIFFIQNALSQTIPGTSF
jgi:hypothetical protein